MTIMFADVKTQLRGSGYQYRIRGLNFDEVLFADDTICISHDTKAMNRMLKTIEEIGAISGMKLNRGKGSAKQLDSVPKQHSNLATKHR